MEPVEVVRIDIAKEDLEDACKYYRPLDYRVVKVDVLGFDYSSSEEWKAAKKESDKAYKRLKEIEFKLRHK